MLPNTSPYRPDRQAAGPGGRSRKSRREAKAAEPKAEAKAAESFDPARELVAALKHGRVGSVRIDAAGRLNLTDLYRAAGAGPDKRPRQWARSKTAAEFMTALAVDTNAQLCALLTTTRGGKEPGTWAHWQIAMAYAKWLSPEFHIKVNRAYAEWIREKRDPQLKFNRAVAAFERQGRSAAWIKLRLDGMTDHAALIRELTARGCRADAHNDFAVVLAMIARAATDLTPAALRERAGLKEKASARDALSDDELRRVGMISAAIVAALRAAKANDRTTCIEVARAVCDKHAAGFRLIDGAATTPVLPAPAPKPRPARKPVPSASRFVPPRGSQGAF